jgi:O-antigen/teichoic acid export membrane protein
MEERPGLFTGVMLVRMLVSTGFAVWLVAWRDAGVGGVLIANLVGMLAASVVILPFTIRRCAWMIDGALLRAMLSFGLIYMVSATASLFLTMGDRYVVKIVAGLAAVGIYTLGQQLAATINVVGQSFLNAYQPLALKRDKTVDGGRFVVKTFTYFAFGVTWVGLGFSLLSREVVLVLARNPGYHPALTVVPLLVLAAIVYVLSIAMEVSLFFAGKARYIAWPTIAGVGVIIALGFALVPLFGIFGAAIAAAVAAGTRLVLIYFWAQRTYPLPYDMGRLALVLATAAAAHLVLLVPGPWWMLVGLKMLVALLFPLMLWRAGFFTPYEQEEVRRTVRKLLGSRDVGANGGR